MTTIVDKNHLFSKLIQRLYKKRREEEKRRKRKAVTIRGARLLLLTILAKGMHEGGVSEVGSGEFERTGVTN